MPDTHTPTPTTQDFWTKELERQSLKEPSFKSKLFYNKPLTIFHFFEPKGFDQRDYYQSKTYDEWDAQVWNLPTKRRGKCGEYYLDYTQCTAYVDAHVNLFNFSWMKYGKYCWKQYENFNNCVEQFGNDHPEYYIKGSKVGH